MKAKAQRKPMGTISENSSLQRVQIPLKFCLWVGYTLSSVLSPQIFGQHNLSSLGSPSSSGGGSQASFADIQNSMQMINDQFGAEIAGAQAEVIQAQNQLAACALQEEGAVDEAKDELADAKASNKGKPLMSALGGLAPGMAEAAKKGLGFANDGKAQAQANVEAIDRNLRAVYEEVQSFSSRPLPPIQGNFIDTNTGQTLPAFETARGQVESMRPSLLCDIQKIKASLQQSGVSGDELQSAAISKMSQCQETIRDAQNRFSNAVGQLPRYQNEIKQGGFFNDQLMASIAAGGMNFVTAKQQADAEIDAAQKNYNRVKKSSSAARALCEQNAKAADAMARQRVTDLNNRKRRALDNLALSSSQPLPLSDTNVPVEDTPTTLGGMPVIGSSEPLTSKDSKLAASNKGGGAGGAASGGGGGSSGGASGDSTPPSWTFSEGEGFPGGGGLPAATKGGKFAAIDGGGAGSGGGFGAFSDPFGADFGEEEGDGIDAQGNISQELAMSGDGGLNLMLVRARYRYGSHASVLLRKIQVKPLAKNTVDSSSRSPAQEGPSEKISPAPINSLKLNRD